MPQMLEVSRCRGMTLLGFFWVVKQRHEGDSHHSVADFAIAAFALAALTSLTQSTPEYAALSCHIFRGPDEILDSTQPKDSLARIRIAEQVWARTWERTGKLSYVIKLIVRC